MLIVIVIVIVMALILTLYSDTGSDTPPDVAGGGRRGRRGLPALDSPLARRGRLPQTLAPDLLCTHHPYPQVTRKVDIW